MAFYIHFSWKHFHQLIAEGILNFENFDLIVQM